MQTKSGEDYQAYCRQRNQIRKITRLARKDFEKNLSLTIKTEPKKFWDYIRSKTKTKDGIADLHIDPTNLESRLTVNDIVLTQVNQVQDVLLEAGTAKAHPSP